jgi:thioredoxin 1
MRRMLFQIALLFVLARPTFAADKLPAYDELADANRDLSAAQTVARRENKPILVVFGANWCPDCRAFDEEMNAPDLGSELALHYVVVKVDVARFKKNVAIANKYGIVIRRGIPAMSLITADETVLSAVDGRKMEELRGQGRPAIIKFLTAAVNAPQASIPVAVPASR